MPKTTHHYKNEYLVTLFAITKNLIVSTKLGLLLLFTITLISCNNLADADIKYPEGGYEFSKNITDESFYFYPLIGKISRRDSFWYAYSDNYMFQLFKEYNISLRPSPKTIIRMAYQGRFDCYMITLTEEEIIVKTGLGSTFRRTDRNLLTEIEKIHFGILKAYYPLDEAPPDWPLPPPPPPALSQEERQREREEKQRERAYDSIKNNTPQLLDGKYYAYLLKKATVKDTFSFTTAKIKITKPEFLSFITQLNQSGYWEKGFSDENCQVTHGFNLSLEFNNGKKYNCAGFYPSCMPDTTLFHKACQKLITMARLGDKKDIGGEKITIAWDE
jgi:hypothetical protein